MPNSGAKQSFVKTEDSGFQKDKAVAILKNTSHPSLKALSQIKINRESKTIGGPGIIGKLKNKLLRIGAA